MVIICVLATAVCTSVDGSKPQVESVRDASVVIKWHEGQPHELHAGWLRERCLSARSVQPSTNQPTHGYHEFSEDAHHIRQASFTDEDLIVTFGDGHESKFSSDFLFRELMHHDTTAIQPSAYTSLQRRMWDGSLTALPQVSFADLNTTDGRLTAVTHMLSSGTVLIKGAPLVDGEVLRLAEKVSALRVTDWGAVFNVRTTPDVQDGENKLDLAYTGDAIPFHTDNPYREAPPDFQLLHAIEHCVCPEDGPSPCESCSVVNYAVDGFFVAQRLCEEDPEAFKLLATVPVRFENNCGNDKSALIRHSPIIQMQASADGRSGLCKLGSLRAISFSVKSGGYAPPMSSEMSSRFYQARRRFSQMLHDPKNMVTFQMAPGDVWMFDNVRVLHARSSLGRSQGSRWLQGCYVDRAMLWHNFEAWRRIRAESMAKQDAIPFPLASDVCAAAGPACRQGNQSLASLVLAKRRMVPGGEFRSLKDGTREEYGLMGRVYTERVDKLAPRRLISMLEAQKGDRLGQPVDLFEHGLQTASRAYRGGEDEETVVVSLLHDLTETIMSKNHGGVVSSLLAPWISPKSQWLLEQHEVFQGKYYFHHFDADPNARDRWVDHEFYNHTANWCEKYDQAAFDPTYPTLPVSFFMPMLKMVLAKAAYWWDPSHPKVMAVTGKAGLE